MMRKIQSGDIVRVLRASTGGEAVRKCVDMDLTARVLCRYAHVPGMLIIDPGFGYGVYVPVDDVELVMSSSDIPVPEYEYA